MKRNTITMLLGLLLAIPVAPVLYALVGGGLTGFVACFLLGMVASAAMRRAVNGVVEGYNWVRYRNAYENDWTTADKSGKL